MIVPANLNPWIITPEERIKFELQFHDLKPINGKINGNQAKNLFMKSNLSTVILGKIWQLSDYDNDGEMTSDQFCIAMHLIKRKLEGYEVPDILPATMKGMGYNPVTTSMNFNTISNFPVANSMNVSYNTTPSNSKIQNGVKPVREEDWAMHQSVRPRYRLQFNQQDRNKRGFLTGVEAKAILVQSGLPHQVLAEIWQLSDVDQDGNLTCDEFCLAMHLVEQARAGKVLPSTLPQCLMPQRRVSGAANHLESIGNNGMMTKAQIQEQKKQVLTGEDERRANYLKGQEELQKRRAVLEEQMRQEEEARKSKEREEFERQEKIRKEKEEQAREILRKQEMERERIRQENERVRLLELEKQRMQIASNEKRHEQDNLSEINSRKGNLMEALANETEKKKDLSKQLETSRDAMENHKTNIGSMRKHRDQLMESSVSLRDELELAKSELNRCQREKQSLELKLQNSLANGSANGVNLGISDPVYEQIKTVQALKLTHQDKIKQLDKEIKDLEQTMTKRGQKLASNRNKMKDIEKKVTTRLVADIKRLQSSVCEKKNAAFAILKTKTRDKSQSFEDEGAATVDRISAFKRIHASNSLTNENLVQTERELIYYEALYQFEGRQNDELSFTAGETIVIDTRDQMEPNSGWLYGWVQNTERSGLFPEVYVNMLRTEPYIQSSRSSVASVNTLDNWASHGDQLNFNTVPANNNYKKPLGNHGISKPQLFAETLYPWQPDSNSIHSYGEGGYSNQLTFEPGKILEIIDNSNDDWLLGKFVHDSNNNNSNHDSASAGWFPRSYVKLLGDKNNGEEDYDNEYFDGEGDGAITPIGASSLVDLAGQSNTHKPTASTTNYNITTSYKTQQLPSQQHSRKSSIQSNSSSSQQQQPISTTTDKICVAMFPYDASVMGDLSLQPGDIIDIHEQKQDWWKGFNRTNQHQGLFPSNYVKCVSNEDLAVQESQKIVSNPGSNNQSAASLFNEDLFDVQSNADVNSMFTSQHSIDSSVYTSIGGSTLDSNHTTSTPEIAQVLVEFKATGSEQLSLQPGQIIQVREKSTSGWWKGEIQQRGQQRKIGWFPGNYVSLINSSQSIDASGLGGGGDVTPPSCHTPTNEGVGADTMSQYTMSAQQQMVPESNPGEYLVTLYNYAAQNTDELTFTKNCVLQLLDKNEPEWWLGLNLTSQLQGLFPVNYVRPLDPSIDAELIKADSSNLSLSSVAGRPVSWYIDGTMSFQAILTEDEKRRQFYIRELIETEKVYYDDLQEVHQVFYEPIKRSNFLSQDELKSIFLNWSDLIPNSYNFYMALKIRKDLAGSQQPIQCIGDILLSNFPNFIVYVRFCSMQNQAIAKLQKKQQQTPKFKELCEQCETNLRCQKMPMTSYFLKPMQRITKYKLLVENILKHTEDNHPDRNDCEEAVAAARSLCESVNEGVRERENSERLEWLQEHVQCDNLGSAGDKLYFNSDTNCLGHRKLLHSGTLYKSRSNKELVGFLCNDFLLLAIPQYNTGGSPFVFPLETSSKDKMQFKMYKKPIILNQVMISTGNPTVVGVGSNSHNDLFTVKEPNYEYVLKALSPNDRDKWVEKLMNASTFYINTENNKRERSMSIRRTAGLGRLLVTVIEANHLSNGGGSNSNSKTIKKEVTRPNAFCEASLGNQLHRTKVQPGTTSPKWNTQMQFLIKNIDRDSLCLTVYNKDYFAPNDFLGRIEVSVSSVLNEKRTNREPIEKKLKLMEIDSGELVIRLDMALFKKI